MCKRGNPATPTNTLAHFCSKKGGSKMSKCSLLECTLPFAAFCLLAKKEKKRQRQHFFANGKKSVALGGNKAVLYFLLKYVGEKKICAKKEEEAMWGKPKSTLISQIPERGCGGWRSGPGTLKKALAHRPARGYRRRYMHTVHSVAPGQPLFRAAHISTRG